MSMLTILICAFGGYICICRALKMNSRTKLPIQFQCMVWFSMFAAAGISSIIDMVLGAETPVILPFMASGIVAHLLLGVPAWRHGAPDYAQNET